MSTYQDKTALTVVVFVYTLVRGSCVCTCMYFSTRLLWTHTILTDSHTSAFVWFTLGNKRALQTSFIFIRGLKWFFMYSCPPSLPSFAPSFPNCSSWKLLLSSSLSSQRLTSSLAHSPLLLSLAPHLFLSSVSPLTWNLGLRAEGVAPLTVLA